MTTLTPLDIAKIVSLSFASSIFIFLTYLMVAMIPLIGCMLSLMAAGLCGYLSGQFIHKVSGYKYGRMLLPWVLVPMLAGMLLNPFSSPLFYIAAAATVGIPIDGIFNSFMLPAIASFTIIIPLMKN